MKKFFLIIVLIFISIFTVFSLSGYKFKRIKVKVLPPKPPEIITKDVFGINGATPEHFKLINKLGVKVLGLNGMSWNTAEPEKSVTGIHNYTLSKNKNLKKLLEQVKKSGRKLHIEIRVYNNWALEFEKSLTIKDPINGIEKKAIIRIKPLHMDDWKKFITYLVENYPVSSVQIGNEPENEWFSVEGYIEALKVAFVTIKKIKPDVIVCAGGFNLGEYCILNDERQRKALNNMFLQHKLAFVRKFIEYGSKYYDVLTMHANRDYGVIVPTNRWFKDIMKKHGVNKDIWFDSMITTPFLGTGKQDSSYFATENDKHLLSRIERNDPSAVKRYWARQSAQTVKKCITAFEAGVKKIFISSDTDLEDHSLACWRHVGLLTNIGNPKPAYFTLKMLIEKIGSFSRVTRIRNYQMRMKKNEPFVFRIDRFDKKPLYIAWLESKQRRLNLSAYSKSEKILITPIVTGLDNKGKPVITRSFIVDARQVKLGKEPVFFELAH